jgi:radical SAM superfamily enzyme YgiQ (UPF0313 family)
VKILLVQPAPFEPGRLGLENVLWFCEPVALTSLAAMVPEHEVRILDMRLEVDMELPRVLQEFQPDLVGTTSMTTECYQALAVLHMAKGILGDKVFTIVGGHHPTLSPREFEAEIVDAICIGEGEETFLELVEHLDASGAHDELGHIAGLRFQTSPGHWHTTKMRPQNRELDTFPAPNRSLIKKYTKDYFFAVCGPMASIFTSRGCSFDCNFCAIWEFYERRTRFLSAKVICDRLEAIEENFVFFLDDNFLTNRKRIEELADEMERRGIEKYWGTQGRTDFIADNPELMARLRRLGLIMVLSGYESNDEDALAALLKKNTVEKNRRAAEIMRELGIASTGIFMVRPDFEEEDFDRLYQHINDLGVAIPLVTILTPLPGTQMYKLWEDRLLTRDTRFFDLMHAVVPTKIPRSIFYKKFAEANQATWPAFEAGSKQFWKKTGRHLILKAFPAFIRFLHRANQYRRVMEDYQSHMRDEVGVIPRSVVAADASRHAIPEKPQSLLVQIGRPDQPASAAVAPAKTNNEVRV